MIFRAQQSTAVAVKIPSAYEWRLCLLPEQRLLADKTFTPSILPISVLIDSIVSSDNMTAMILSTNISHSDLSLLVHTQNRDEDVVEEEFGSLCLEETRIKVGVWNSKRLCLASTRAKCDVNDYRDLTRFPFVEGTQLYFSLEEVVVDNTPIYDIKLKTTPLEINLNKNSTNLLLSTINNMSMNKVKFLFTDSTLIFLATIA